MGAHQKAKLFTHGGSQAVRLPKAFRFDGSEVTVERTDEGVLLRAPSAAHGDELWAVIDGLRADQRLDYSTQSMIEHVPSFD